MNDRIRTVRTDSSTTEYFTFGGGENVAVILPGLSVQSVTGAAEAVEAEYGVFKDDFTVYLLDRRLDPPPAYTVRDMADDAEAAMDALGLRDVCLFGASQGGMIAAVIAARRPDLAGKLALASTALTVTDEGIAVIEKWISLAEAGDGVGLYLDFGEKVYPPRTFAAYRDALIAAGGTVTGEELERFAVLAAGTRGFDAADDIKRIKCPVLVTGSDDDRVLGPDAVREVIRAFGGRAATHVYSGYGHAAYDTAPDFRDRLFRFFKG